MLNNPHNNLRAYTFKTTVVSGTSCSLRDELLACQHPTSEVSSSVYIESDYVFDISVDTNISVQVCQLCKDLIKEYPESELFIFSC